ncbi:alpha/beta-hydrolase [Annulohypoxylon maeteangense]|uniref:alpha/beta-hydrolase n=1 Tax=Annulohypoxylon maeteangense TaxID=1927788 RepID=UPI002007C1A6|nr:alpha/beta-hydrolase [Annulohypoxylon maeteangense]KAI0883619.1 alpha/beta-hydrolase [Annulohypoxylon maeteangense]
MTAPSILLIPGSFGIPEFYDNITEAVKAKGYEIKGLRLPSVGLKDEPRGIPPTLYDDAAFIAKEVTVLADEGKDVMLIGHSYGGIAITQSTKGLTKGERQRQGKKGGIIRLSYITALVPPLGVSSMNILSTIPDENRVKLATDDKGWLYISNIHEAALITLSDYSDKAAREALVEQFQCHSSVSFTNELTYAGYKDVPVSYLFCEEDSCVIPQTQRDGIEVVEKESGNRVDITYVKAGHCPSVTTPQEVIDWIIRAAEKGETV